MLLLRGGSRVDRCGPAFAQEFDNGRLLLATYGQPQPDVAIELDRDGQVARRLDAFDADQEARAREEAT